MEIERLVDVEARDVWAHEARHFTPWLSRNLDRLSEAIGINLELEGVEIAVDQYSADILALDITGNRRVLIENQLNPSDHSHLGQILTYLSGVESEVMIWISPKFSEAHLSAVNWLNDNTVDPFAFFAIQLRVVKIADSPPALVLDVLARPNDWERSLKAKAAASPLRTRRGEIRADYWAELVEARPSLVERGVVVNGSASQWIQIPDSEEMLISCYFAIDEIGLFMRGPRGTSATDFNAVFSKARDEFISLVSGDVVGGQPNDRNHPCTVMNINTADRGTWPDAVAWHLKTIDEWTSAQREVFG